MTFELIFASDINGVIGNNNTIPWYVPEDLTYFRKITTYGIVIMGRKTFESLPNGYLKNRINIVITNNYKNYNNIDNTLIFTDFDNVFTTIENIQKETNKKVFIIGGSMIYRIFFKYCNIIHRTVIYNTNVSTVYNPDDNIMFPYSIHNFVDYKNIYESDILCSKNNNIQYQHFTYKKIE
jgi:dihydrofolate reductase